MAGLTADYLGEAIAARQVTAQCADLGLELFGGSLDLAEPTSVLNCNTDAERQFLEQREVGVGEKLLSTRIDRLDNAQALIACQQRSDEQRPCGNSRLSIHAGIKAGVGLRIVHLFRLATAQRRTGNP